jgi:hypothetical protein
MAERDTVADGSMVWLRASLGRAVNICFMRAAAFAATHIVLASMASSKMDAMDALAVALFAVGRNARPMASYSFFSCLVLLEDGKALAGWH